MYGSGVHAKVNIYANMTLTNQNISRSAIDIAEGGILDLYVADGVSVTVNSGYGAKGENASGYGAQGGPGGYAGIHVPENATLNLYGSGIIKAIGGDAGAGGGDTNSGNTGGGGRRRRWCWYWWKWRQRRRRKLCISHKCSRFWL
jgi:hypothetical protein